MMQSMTGFGKAVSEFTDKKVVIEVKSLNSKQLDLYTKINYFYRSKELEIRNLVQQELGRGKVELSLVVDQVSEATAGVQINKVAFNNYVNQIKEISEESGVALPNDWFTVVMRMPEVLKQEQNEELTEEEWEQTLSAIKDALKALNEFRTQEGEGLKKFFIERIPCNPRSGQNAQAGRRRTQRIVKCVEVFANSLRIGRAIRHRFKWF